MAVPSISSITPSSGPTGGSLLVEIAGDGFRLPTSSDVPSVRMLIGGRAGRDVRVLAVDRLTCLAPAADAGSVDVTLQNLDADGVVVPGEEVTAAQAFTYVLPQLTPEA